MTIKTVTEYLEKLFPPEIADEDDKAKIGLQVGSFFDECSGVALCLDCTLSVLKQSFESGCNLVLCHHPLIYHPLQEISTDEGKGKAIAYAIKNNITVFALHTNLDKAAGGINDYLVSKVFDAIVTGNDGCVFFGEFCDDKAIALKDFAALISNKLNDKTVKFVGDADTKIKRFAVCSGGGAYFYKIAKDSGADVYITGDIPHHVYIEASEDGFNLIEFSHYFSEIVAVDILLSALKSRFENLRVLNALQCCPFGTLEEL